MSMRFELRITVRDSSGREVYADPTVGRCVFMDFPPWVPLSAVHERTGSFSTQFTLQRSGEYLVRVFVRAGESYDTIEGTFKVA